MEIYHPSRQIRIRGGRETQTEIRLLEGVEVVCAVVEGPVRGDGVGDGVGVGGGACGQGELIGRRRDNRAFT